MIKAVLNKNGLTPIRVFGLSRINIERLMEGMPIYFEGSEVGLPGRIMIVFGETEETIEKELRDHFDKG